MRCPQRTDVRNRVLERFQALGRLYLYSIVQRQPVPSKLSSPLLLAGLLAVDVIRDPGDSSRLALSEDELIAEVERATGGGLKWLLSALAPEAVETSSAAFSLSSLTFGEMPDAEPITPANRERKLRHALGRILSDKRREIMAAISEGFTLGGEFTEIRDLLRTFTQRELREVVSGQEDITPETFLKCLQPVWPDEECKSSAGSSSSSSNTLDFDQLQANVALFKEVLASPSFAPHLKELLRYVTGSPCIIDKDMRIKLQFVRGQPKTTVPRAHTCFQTLDLSADRYDSPEHLRCLLVTCARNSKSFGMR